MIVALVGCGFGLAVDVFFSRPSARATGGRSPTIAVRSLRSGLPRRHLRPPSAPFRFPRAHRRRSAPCRPHRGAAVCVVRGAARAVVRDESCGARRVAAARAATIGIRVVGRRGVVACALAGSGVLKLQHHRGESGDGRRGDGSPQPADRFAPPIGHLSSSDDEWRPERSMVSDTQAPPTRIRRCLTPELVLRIRWCLTPESVLQNHGCLTPESVLRIRRCLTLESVLLIRRCLTPESALRLYPRQTPARTSALPKWVSDTLEAPFKPVARLCGCQTPKRRLLAKRHHHAARRRVSLRRPPARPNGDGQRKMLLARRSLRKNAKHTVRPGGRKISPARVRCGGVPGCAGRR